MEVVPITGKFGARVTGVDLAKPLSNSKETAYRAVKGNDDFWHTDGCTRGGPRSWLSILQAVDVPPYGRDTLYCDMEAAYDRLSPPVQKFLDGRTALHSYGVQKPD